MPRLHTTLAVPLALLCAAAAAVASPAALARTVALLPSVGAAAESDRRALDAALRRALEGVDGEALQSSTATRAPVLSMAEMGVVCIAADVPCLVKFGLLASVQMVLVPVAGQPRAAKSSDALDVEIGVIDVASAQRVRAVGARIPPTDSSSIDELVRGALGQEIARIKPTPDPGQPSPVDPTPAPPALQADPMATAGIAIAGVSGGLAVIGLGAGALAELAWAGILPVAATSRRDVIQPAGAGVWIGTALATVGLGVGLGIFAAAPPPPSEDRAPVDPPSFHDGEP